MEFIVVFSVISLGALYCALCKQNTEYTYLITEVETSPKTKTRIKGNSIQVCYNGCKATVQRIFDTMWSCIIDGVGTSIELTNGSQFELYDKRFQFIVRERTLNHQALAATLGGYSRSSAFYLFKFLHCSRLL